ncbi:MAG: GIY-YIG nuclease family protein [Planctomycetota bacterium]|jgi:putative endonuclease
MWYVYLARNRRGDLYCGISTDVERRINEHNTNKKKAAKACWSYKPVTLVWTSHVYKSKSGALKREAKIKAMTKADKEALVEGGSE